MRGGRGRFVRIFAGDLRGERLFADRHHEHDDAQHHQNGDAGKDDVIAGVLARGDEEADHRQCDHAADGAHEVDDGVGARAQGLGRQIRHQRDGRGTIGRHGDERQAERNDEHREIAGCRRAGEQHHQQDGSRRAADDERRALAKGRIHLVGKRADQGQEEHSENVVRCHDRTDERFVQMEGALQDQRNDAVVHLPEGADGQEGQTDQQGALVVQFHGYSLLVGFVVYSIP